MLDFIGSFSYLTKKKLPRCTLIDGIFNIVLIYSQMRRLVSFPLEDPHCRLDEVAQDIQVWDV